jgi:UDP-glucose/GDP-mannose dehydrogenase family, central domain
LKQFAHACGRGGELSWKALPIPAPQPKSSSQRSKQLDSEGEEIFTCVSRPNGLAPATSSIPKSNPTNHRRSQPCLRRCSGRILWLGLIASDDCFIPVCGRDGQTPRTPFRGVNIGLVNEVALMCRSLRANVWEIIDAAASKSFGSISFSAAD